MATSVKWTGGELEVNLTELSPKIKRALTAVVAFEAPRAEAFMKANASWRDQTGNARSGLTARPYSRGNAFGINLSHAVPYGIWLEVRFAGRYAIINPTIQRMGPEVMLTASQVFGRL